MIDKITAEKESISMMFSFFLRREQLKMSKEDFKHFHPPQAMQEFLLEYMDACIEDNSDQEEIYGIIVAMLDTILLFGMSLQKRGWNYNSLTECGCMNVTDEEIEEFLKGN